MIHKDTDDTYIKCINCGEVSIKRSAQQTHLMAYAKIVTSHGDAYVCEKDWRKSVLRLGVDGALTYWRNKIDMSDERENDNVS